MSKSTFKLYVDELGMSHPKSYNISPYYILLGCIIDENYQRNLSDYANHIKFKYWGRTDVIFHSAEIARNLNDFSIFNNNSNKRDEFIDDLLELLSKTPVTITASVINKQKAHQNSWSEKTVIRQTAEVVLFNFLAFIYTKRPCKGHIIIEASSAQRDVIYLEAFNHILSPSFKRANPHFIDIRNHLTSINFVTKQNHDIESQVADLLVYGIKCQMEKDNGIIFDKHSYEDKITNIANSKLIKPIPSMSKDKKIFYDLITPVDIKPKKKVIRKKISKKKNAVEP